MPWQIRQVYERTDQQHPKSTQSSQIWASLSIIKAGVSHIDPEGRVDVTNVSREVVWYKSQAYVKPEVDLAKIIDVYGVPLAAK